MILARQLPNLWEITKLENVLALIKNGTTQTQNKEGRGIPVTRIETISEGVINPERVGWIAIEEGLRDYELQFEDILFSHINSIEHLGKCAIYEGVPARLIHGMNLLLLRCNKNLIEPAFLHYYLLSEIALRIIRSRAGKAVNQASINQKSLQSIQVPLPPLPEQRRIVEILRQADELRSLRRQADEKAKQLLPALFEKMFGDPIRKSGKGIEQMLGSFVTIISSLVNPKKPEYRDMTHVGSDNIESSTGHFINLNTIEEVGAISGKFLFTKDEVLYSKIRPALRKVATPSFTGLCSADIYPLSTDKEQVNKIFLAQLLRSNHFTDYASKVSGRAQIPKMNRDDLFQYRTFLPDVDLQNEFAKQAEIINSSFEFRKKVSTDLEELFQLLLAQAFTGELTEQWRQEHQEELVAAATERDRLLGKARVINASAQIETTATIEAEAFSEEGLSFAALKNLFATKITDAQPTPVPAALPDGLLTAEDFDIENHSAQRLLEALAGTASLLSATTLTEDIEEEIPHFVSAFLVPSDDAEARTDFSSTE